MPNVLPKDKKIAIITALCEGSSIRSVERVTGVHRDTIMRLGVRAGKDCVESKHVSSVPVTETFRGQTVWDGVVEVFELIGHPKATTLYAWSHATDGPDKSKRHVTILHGGKITSPVMAVRASIIDDFRNPNAPAEA